MKKILLLLLILATFVVSCGSKNSNLQDKTENIKKIESKEIDDSFGVEIYGETLEEAHKNFKTTLIEGQRNLNQTENWLHHLKIAEWN